jgi:hypothetical protein
MLYSYPMTQVPCYICQKATEIDDILRHLRGHSDEDCAKAHKKIVKGKRGEKVDEPIGGSYVKLDKTKKDVV